MARLPIQTRETTDDPALQDAFDGMAELGLEKFLNQLGVLGNHPALAQAVFGMLRAYYEDSVVPRRYLELAILLVSARNRCDYCVVHHAPPALAEGVTAAQLAAIEDGTWARSGLFDEIERDVLRYTEQLSSRGGRIDESLFAALRRHFDDKQLVELTVRAAMCEFFNRFNEAFQIDVEPVAEVLYRTATGREGRTDNDEEPAALATAAPVSSKA